MSELPIYLGINVGKEEVKPTVIIILSTLLLTIDRYSGSMTFVPESFAGGSNFAGIFRMFAMAFALFALVPLSVVVFGFRESPKKYGLALGNWKRGVILTALLFPAIAVALLYPASQNAEMRAFYPLDKAALTSGVAFVRLELIRGILFYTAWEFLFRGFILFGLRPYVGDWLAICIQTIPSCLWHIGLPTGEIVSSIAGGLLFGILAVRTNSILWPYLLHCLIGIGLDFFITITP
ncbi:MAG: CPBP family intramembrane glutamic endopeptidase [Bacteroidota bacterium]|jgi:membrane protease YdiL (CAAX protease family)